MGRAERGFIGVLLRLQAAQRKREAGDTTCDSDALTTHCVLGMLQQGLESLPPGPPVAAAPPAAPAEPERTRPLAFSELTEHEQQRSRLRSEADGYTLPNRVRVKQIRQLGGLPPDCDYRTVTTSRRGPSCLTSSSMAPAQTCSGRTPTSPGTRRRRRSRRTEGRLRRGCRMVGSCVPAASANSSAPQRISGLERLVHSSGRCGTRHRQESQHGASRRPAPHRHG
jgi:hypothetical protein